MGNVLHRVSHKNAFLLINKNIWNSKCKLSGSLSGFLDEINVPQKRLVIKGLIVFAFSALDNLDL